MEKLIQLFIFCLPRTLICLRYFQRNVPFYFIDCYIIVSYFQLEARSISLVHLLRADLYPRGADRILFVRSLRKVSLDMETKSLKPNAYGLSRAFIVSFFLYSFPWLGVEPRANFSFPAQTAAHKYWITASSTLVR